MPDLFGINDPSLERSIRKTATRRATWRIGLVLRAGVTGVAVGLGILVARLCHFDSTETYGLIVGAAVISACLFGWLARKSYRRELEVTLRGMPNRCTRCGYDMQGAARYRCPECGTRFALEEFVDAAAVRKTST